MNLRGKCLEMVRAMDDDELWEFVKPLLFDDAGVERKASSDEPKRGPGRPKKVIDKGGDEDAPVERKRGRKAKKEAKEAKGSNGASDLSKAVLKYVMKSDGCAVGAVAEKLGEDKTKVAATLKALVAAKEIAKAGERRFTRYGATEKIAKAASLAARGK